MRPCELLPNFDNLFETFVDNAIGRNRDIWDFCRILDSIEGTYCIALDGQWGSGKTFFVKQVKMILDALNPNVKNEEMGAEKEQQVQSVCKSLSGGHYVEMQPQVCVYYDAWKNDNDNDPILSIVYSILQASESSFQFPSESNFFDKAAAIFDYFSGKNIKDVVESFKNHTIIDTLQAEKTLEKSISEFFDSLLPEKGNRLVVFIDELDRCKPTYAIQVLERIKHYFGNERITFVFSINAKELEHTISNYYGADFDSGRYLDRFFDMRIALPKPDMNCFYNSIDYVVTDRWYDVVCRAFIQTYDLSMREISRYVVATKFVAPKNQSYYNPSSTYFAKNVVLPVMIGLKLRSARQYNEFINGDNSKPLIDVAKNVPWQCYDFLLSEGECYAEDEIFADGKKGILLENRLNEYYGVLFSSLQPLERNKSKIRIDSGTADTLKHIASGIEFRELSEENNK